MTQASGMDWDAGGAWGMAVYGAREQLVHWQAPCCAALLCQSLEAACRGPHHVLHSYSHVKRVSTHPAVCRCCLASGEAGGCCCWG